MEFEVWEDNAGGLHLAALERGECVFYGHGYEAMVPEALWFDVQGLRRGADPRAEGWHGHPDPASAYRSLVDDAAGPRLIADANGVRYKLLGEAGRRVFGSPPAEALASADWAAPWPQGGE